MIKSGYLKDKNDNKLDVSSNDIVISSEQPTSNDWKLWINPDGTLNNIGSEVVDSLNGNELNMAPSVRAVNEINTYSTNEQVVGRWIDGKPLYRKVIDAGAFPNNNVSEYNTGIPRNCTITGLDVMGCVKTTKVFMRVPYISQNGNFIRANIWADGTQYYVEILSNYDTSAYNLLAVIHYTKD